LGLLTQHPELRRRVRSSRYTPAATSRRYPDTPATARQRSDRPARLPGRFHQNRRSL